MSRTLWMMCFLLVGTTVLAAPIKRRPIPPKPIEIATLTRTFGEKVAEVWDREIQPTIDSSDHTKSANTVTMNVMWMDGRFLSKPFEVTRQGILDATSGFSRGVMYLIRYGDTQYVGLVKSNDRWRSFALTLNGDNLAGDTDKPAPAAQLQKLDATFVTDPAKVRIYLAPWFRKITLPDTAFK